MTKAQVANGTILTVGGLGAMLALATQLGFIGPREQITELRTQRSADMQRVERLEGEMQNVANDVSALVLSQCMATDNEAIWTALRCTGRMGRNFDATIAHRRR